MDGIDYWRVADHYSIVQAAILACGEDPQDLQYSVERSSAHRPEGYVALRTALFNAVRSGQLETQAVEYERDEYGNASGLDIHSTLIAAADLDSFLRARGRVCEIFDRSGLEVAGNPRAGRPQFPAKLDAAIKAWNAVTSDPTCLRGKSPKQALAKWLMDNADELGLLNRHGKPNTTGIEEICKVANWKPGGGATPTPEVLPPPPILRRLTAPVLRQSTGDREDFTEDLDDEIPF